MSSMFSKVLFAQAGVRFFGGTPINLVPPAISGVVAHGSVLTVTPGTWTGSPVIARQWYAGAVPIAGETGLTYTVDRVNGGYYTGITCVERPLGSSGGSPTVSNTLAYDYLVGLGSTAIVHDLALGVSVVSGEVDAITDQSGSNTIAAPTAVQRPAYTASDPLYNGQPTMTGDGSDDTLRIATASLGGAYRGSSILVGHQASLVTTAVWQSYSINGVNNRTSSGGLMQVILNTSGLVVSVTPYASPHCWICAADATQIHLFVDGTEQGTPATIAGTIPDGQPYALLNRSDSVGVGAPATLGFAALTMDQLTASQCADFGQYSRERWTTL